MPRGNSYTPGLRQSPEMLKIFRPVDFSVPTLLNHWGPLARMQAAQARVSTLFTTDG